MKKILIRTLLVILALVICLAVYGYFTFIRGNARAQEGIVIEEWSVNEIEDIPVAMDVTPDGKVYVTETGQFMQGAGDNRQQSFWLMDDLASTSTADRLAYIKKWIAAGELTDDWFDSVHDTLRVIEDSDNDGRADKSIVVIEIGGYLDGLMAGVLVTDDGILITDIPKVYKLKDTDGDLKADVSEVLSEGYGVRTAFVGHDLHGLTWGPDGKIYYSIGDRGFNITSREGRKIQAPLDQGRGGVFRMNPDGSELELYAWGLRNPQELAFDNYGNLVTGDNNSDGGDKARIVYVVEGGDSGWTYGYQYMEDGDYLRGPWNAERMWEPYHEGQPAWIVPPLANETNGPSGLAFYPGLGLPERYKDHFFLSNYSFIASESQISSFSLIPDGAGFKVDDFHHFAEDDLYIDQAFGYDGKLYAITASVFPGPEKKVLTFHHAEKINDPRIGEVRAYLLAGLETLDSSELLTLLGNIDRRMRLKAQFELVRRNSLTELTDIARSPDASEMERIHALWGLGQLGATAFASWQDFSAFSASQPEEGQSELLAQAIKVAGEARAVNLRGAVRDLINHAQPRVAYFAAMSAAKLGDHDAIPELVRLLETNNSKDPFLRHAAVWALTELNDAEAVNNLRDHASAAVRMGVLLVQRRMQDPRIAAFLQDPDPGLVVEAARAIHDMRIEEALPALAALAETTLPVTGEDPQTSYALHRRAINANLLIGGEAQATALGSYAANQQNPLAMRTLALQTLGDFAEPPVLDKVWGDHMILAEREKTVVATAIDTYIPGLIKGELGDLAMEVALKYDRIPLDDDALAALVADESATEKRRSSALRALARRPAAKSTGLLLVAVESARGSKQPALRALGLEVLDELEPERAGMLALEIARADMSSSLFERQAAIALLGSQASAAAEDYLVAQLAALEQGGLSDAIQLDVFNAATASASKRVQDALQSYQLAISAKPQIEQRLLARYGGDAEKGRSLFQNLGDCMRCHSINGEGGIAGPDLAGVAAKYDVDYLYRALVDPNADIAPGFAHVSLQLQDGTSMAGIMINESADVIRLSQNTGHGEPQIVDVATVDIETKNGPFSGMPAMGLLLSLDDLRDVMAYLQTLTTVQAR